MRGGISGAVLAAVLAASLGTGLTAGFAAGRAAGMTRDGSGLPSSSSSSATPAAAAAAARPAVVDVLARRGAGRCGAAEDEARGSGVIVRANGAILTSHHVIAGADSVEVRFADGTALPARIVGRDAWADLALLRVEAPAPLPALEFAGRAPAPGETVIALGAPFGFSGSVSAGVVSGFERAFSDDDPVGYLQHDAAINPGSSGGPLLDLEGRIVGINAAIPDPASYDVGVGLATPAALAAASTAAMLAEGAVRRPWLGVTGQHLPPALAEGLGAAGGVAVIGLEPGGPAASAGLALGDVVTAAGGRPVRSLRDFTRALAAAEPGAPFALETLRGGARIARMARPVARIAAPPPVEAAKPCLRPQAAEAAAGSADLSLTLAGEATTRSARPTAADGAEILVVGRAGAAEAAGLRAGDVILSVGDLRVTDAATARRALDARTGGALALLVRREGRTLGYLLVRPGARGAEGLSGNAGPSVQGPF